MLAATGIIICLPLFFLFSVKEEWYPSFYWVARNIWAKLILFGMGLIPKVEFSENLEKHTETIILSGSGLGAFPAASLLYLWWRGKPSTQLPRLELTEEETQ